MFRYIQNKLIQQPHVRSVFTKYPLKYGINPNNRISGYFFKKEPTFELLHGTPSYINILDSMLGWNLVSEVKDRLNFTTAASYKHNAPAGVSIAKNKNTNSSEDYEAVYNARNCDSLSSFGDFIALSGTVDYSVAKYLNTQVSDGIIAEDFTEDALELLKKKKRGKYIIMKGLKTDCYGMTFRDHFGVTLYQSKDMSVFNNVRMLSDHDKIDALLGWITLKYTPSNSVNLTYNGQVIGIGAGQQNRLECIHIAGKKTKEWLKYNNVKDIKFTMCSDGFLPFIDNIDAAELYNVKLILQPGGSIKDKNIKQKANSKDIEMIYTDQRTFYH